MLLASAVRGGEKENIEIILDFFLAHVDNKDEGKELGFVADIRAAFWDFDGTMARGDSIVPYLRYCIELGEARRTQFLRAARGYLRFRLRPQNAGIAKEDTLSFLRGKSVAHMDDVARSFFQQRYMDRLFPEAVTTLWQLRELGVRIVVVSASPDAYMRVLNELLPIDAVLATPCGVDAQGRYTGKVGPNCKGEEKVRRIQGWLRENGLTLDADHSFAYGDSASDVPMLRLVGHATLVRPKGQTQALLPGAQVVNWRAAKKR